MTSTPYSSIGPFKGVPSDVLAVAARHANNAHEASVVAILRQAAAVGDEASRTDIIHPSLAVANSVWSAVEFDAASSLKSAKSDYYTWLVPVVALGGAAAFFLLAATVGGRQECFAPGMAAALVFAVAGGMLYAPVGKPAKTAIRQIREQGYFDDTLPEALGRVAGKCLLPGSQALHVASTDATGNVSVKTLYWDAIGYARSEIDGNGLERVDIYGREGSRLASITGPTGTDRYVDATSLVALVAERGVEKSRKAA
jgi:hypothetical protein